jgi:hypothetical protein
MISAAWKLVGKEHMASEEMRLRCESLEILMKKVQWVWNVGMTFLNKLETNIWRLYLGVGLEQLGAVGNPLSYFCWLVCVMIPCGNFGNVEIYTYNEYSSTSS